MSPEPEKPAPLQGGPLFALLLTLGAGSAQVLALVALLGLGLPIGPGLFGMSALLGHAAFFTMLAPRLGDSPAASLGFVPPPLGHRLAVLLLLPSALLVSEVDNWANALFPLPEREEPSGLEPAPRSWLYQIALVQIVVMPMVYELFYRGLLQPWLVRSLGVRRGVVATAALNGLAAGLALLEPRDFASVAASALILGLVRQATGSLVPCLTLHSLTGTIVFAAHFRAFGIAGFDDTSQPHTPFFWLLLGAAFTAAGIARLRRLRPAEPPDPDPPDSPESDPAPPPPED